MRSLTAERCQPAGRRQAGGRPPSPPRGGAGFLRDLLGPRGAGDDAGDDGLAGEPAHRQLQHRVAARLREVLELEKDIEVVLTEDVAREAGEGGIGEAGALRRRLAGAILAREETG